MNNRLKETSAVSQKLGLIERNMSFSLDIIIVNWNAGDQLRNCLRTISDACRDTDIRLGQVCVVDNGSTDGSSDNIVSWGLPLTLVRNVRNQGFAAACNQGAKGSCSEFLLFLNPDTRLMPDSLIGPLSMLADPVHRRTGIAGIQLLDDMGNISRSCARFPAPSLFFYKMIGLDRFFPDRCFSHIMTDWDHRQTRIVDHVIGAFYLVRNKVFQELGGFDSRFFVYLEDLDFSLRAFQRGWQTCYFSEFKAYHKGGGSSEAVKDIRLFYALRSLMLYGFKHFLWIKALLLVLGVLFLEPNARLGNGVLIKSPGQLRDSLKAYAMLWKDLPNWSRLCLKMSDTPPSPEIKKCLGLS
jgi:hypothetical protein